MTPLVEIADLHKRFAGVQALQGVSLSLMPGQTHALVGENGAGKSTLIKIMTGAYQPDSGSVRFRGVPVRFATPTQAQDAGIATIYQEVNLVPLMSAARNLFLGREPRTRLGLVDVAAMNRRAAEILAEYGVQVDVRRPLGEHGLGTQQMVALARAVMADAKVVVMDEPTSCLEPREVDTLFGVIRTLHARGIGIIYVSHRLDELYAICDHVTVLRDGKVVHSGPLAELDRLRLVALMLGRDLAEVKRTGTTRFSNDRRSREPEVVLRADDLSSGHRLHGVSVDVHAGEVVGLGGLLGAGRTETIKAVAGALPLDGGSVALSGKRVGRGTVAAVRAGVVMLPEDRKTEGIVPGLSVRDNIALAILPRMSRAGVVSDRRIDTVVRQFMTRLRIKASSPEQPVSELSGGNQQKVMLARLLATDPRVLLLDEPTRGIDVGAKAEVQELTDELAEQGLAIVLVSSDAEELIEGSDRVVVLKDGRSVGELAGADVDVTRLMTLIAAESEVVTDE